MTTDCSPTRDLWLCIRGSQNLSLRLKRFQISTHSRSYTFPPLHLTRCIGVGRTGAATACFMWNNGNKKQVKGMEDLVV